MKPQTIFRNASPDKPYTMICNSAIRDVTLTPEAGWVLVFMLSQPNDWGFNLLHLAASRRMGRNRTQKAVSELMKRGYCKRVRQRKKDGKLGSYEYWFTDEPGTFESPQPKDGAMVEASPQPKQPALDFGAPYKGLVSHKKTETQKPQFVEGAGDRLIPFDVTDPETILEAGRVAAAKEALGADIDRLPFSKSVIRKISALGVDPWELAKDYARKTRGKPIGNPDGYLLKMAREKVAQREGVSVEVVADLSKMAQIDKAIHLAAEVGVRPARSEWQKRAAVNTDRSALLRALRKVSA